MAEYIVKLEGSMIMEDLYDVDENTLPKIIRCKDCKFSGVMDKNRWPATVDNSLVGKMYCCVWGEGYHGEWVKPDGFCYKGVKRDG